jgi:hypothetical protein
VAPRVPPNCHAKAATSPHQIRRNHRCLEFAARLFAGIAETKFKGVMAGLDPAIHVSV